MVNTIRKLGLLTLMVTLVARVALADTVSGTVADRNSLSTLATAIKAAELTQTLKGEGPFTLFAPTDKAFAKLGEEKVKELLDNPAELKKILLAHVVVGKKLSGKQIEAMSGQDLNGFNISSGDGFLKLGNAEIINTDIRCDNGVIHQIDTVLIPE